MQYFSCKRLRFLDGWPTWGVWSSLFLPSSVFYMFFVPQIRVYNIIYIHTWSFKSTLISARANFCSRNPNLLVLPISARGTARFENNHFSNVRSFAGNCARLREIALVVRPVFFESETGSENSRSARLANFCSWWKNALDLPKTYTNKKTTRN